MNLNYLKYIILSVFFVLGSFAKAQISEGYIGQNYWYQLDDVWYRVEEMDPEMIRVGGIQFNTNYKGTAWYDHVLDQIESANAEPLVQISETWTLTQFNELMSHFINTGRKINYFSVGNEPDHNNRVPDVNDIIKYYNDIAPRIRLYFPEAKIMGPCWANFYDSFIKDKYFKFIDGTKNTKDYFGKYVLNIFSFHSYASAFSSGGAGIFDLSTFKSRMDILLPKIDEVNATRPAGEKLNWSLTEFHTTYNNTELNIGGTIRQVPETHKTYSFYAGQYFAQLYGYGMEKKAFGMFPWSIYESGGTRGNGDLGILEGGTDFLPRSTYYHTQMLMQNLRSKTITHIDNKDDVEIVAMQDASGITVMVMNTQYNTYDLSLELDLSSSAPKNLAITVDAGINKAITDNIPATTTKLFVFDNLGNLIKIITYSKENADAKTAPTTQRYHVDYVHKIPSKVEAEQFSTQSGLTISAVVSSEGTGENLTNTNSGDYAEYVVDVLEDDKYIVDFRVASLSGGASLALKVDGSEVLSDLQIKSTGGLQKWATVSDTITLLKGKHTLKLEVLEGSFSINWMDVYALPIVMFTNIKDGDQFDISSNIDVNVVANYDAGVSTISLYIDDVFLRTEDSAPFDWGLRTDDPELNKLTIGEHILKAVSESKIGERDSVSIKIKIKDPAGFAFFESEQLQVFPNPVSTELHFTTRGEWSIFDLTGQKVLEGNHSPVSVSGLASGVYLLKLNNRVTQFIKL